MFLSRLLAIKYRLRILFLALVLFTTFVLLTYKPATDVRRCFIDLDHIAQPQLPAELNPPSTSTSATLKAISQKLEDILLADVKPKPGKSIFFHETSCPHYRRLKVDSILGRATPLNLVHLGARQACAVESAAKHNPNFSVFVLFARPVYYDNNITNPILEALHSYSNIHLRNLNLWTYAANTPIYEWLKEGKLFSSKYVLSHVSDFLRYLTLWRWGGTYLDMDTVTLRSLEDMEPNYTGAESDKNLAAGVMNFEPTGFGHEVALQCLHDFQKNFDGNDWGTNGPGVITRVIRHLCGTQNIELMMDRRRCMNFHVHERNAFYAIPWREWEHFVESQYFDSTMKRLNISYVAHVWNKFSQHRHFKIGSNVAYDKIAQLHCPKVYKTAGEYF